MALNHSEVAIASHQANFTRTRHIRADLRAPHDGLIPKADVVWMSPACTWHSIANGGLATDEQSRAQAEEAPRYGITADANCLMFENVKEFRDWGPTQDKLDKNNQPVLRRNKKTGQLERVRIPIKKRKGEYYHQWVAALRAMGYVNYEWQLFNSADFGVPQSRIRYYAIFTRAGIPIRWPRPTHHRIGAGGLLPWRGVRECLHLADKGRSVFNRGKLTKKGVWRAKPLSDNTLRRLIAGLRKFVFGQPFLTHYYSGGGQLSNLGAPCPTVTTNPHARLVSPLLFQNNGVRAHDAAARMTRLLDEVAPTLTTNGGNLNQVTLAPFVHTYYRHGSVRQLSEPSPTLTCHDRIGLCQSEGFLFNHQFTNEPWSLDAATRTVVASRRHQYVAQILRGCPQLQPQPGDSVTMRLLKALCRRHGIADVHMRMLHVGELKRIMGFPDDYQLLGNQTEQKEMLGNAVTPIVPQRMAEAMTQPLLAAQRRRQRPLKLREVERWEQGELFTAIKS